MIKAIYPGTFDPPTNGHLDLIERSSRLFDYVIVAIGEQSTKKPLFSIQERLDMLRELCAPFPNVEVDHFSGLLVHYAREKGVTIIIRGLRAVSDFEYEMQMALMNRKLAPDIETVFLMTSAKWSFLSSSLVKEVALLGGCVKQLVPPLVEKYLKEKRKNEGHQG
ncbi:pantetheine-phosphate adenylyltransferase [bacterium]|nr:pantetheine-phosphate adenylyltransferase [bacterium]